MIQIAWTSKAQHDVVRLHEFLSVVNARAARSVVQMLVAAPARLEQHPRIGERIDEFAPREIRLLLVGKYEMRYEIAGPNIYILRIWHSRENH